MNYRFVMTPNAPRTRAAQTVSVTKIGRIDLPKYFVQTHDVRQGTRAQLYWDEDTKRIAIGFVDGDDPTAFPVFLLASGGAYINARRLFRIRGVRPEEYAQPYTYQQYRAADVGIGDAVKDVFVIELKKHHPED